MSQSQCPNCKMTLGCTCKLRTASDGRQCCTTCVASYNERISGGTPAKVNPANWPPATPSPSNGNQAPSNVSAVYLGPGQQIKK